jgi:hypothetical protein
VVLGRWVSHGTDQVTGVSPVGRRESHGQGIAAISAPWMVELSCGDASMAAVQWRTGSGGWFVEESELILAGGEWRVVLGGRRAAPG